MEQKSLDKNVILTTYFTAKKDPQRSVFTAQNNFALIRTWYKSIVNLNLSGIIFHDELSNTFIEKYTNKNIQFIPYTHITNWSINDERFLCYYKFILENKQYENIFLTDAFDITFYKNPFLLFDEKHLIYVGSDTNITICKSKFMKTAMLKSYKRITCKHNIIANAGVIGGARNVLLQLLTKMIENMKSINSPENINMAVFNNTLYNMFPPNKILLGHPLTSKFKKNEKHGKFFIKHK